MLPILFIYFFFFFCFYLSKKVRLDVSCESSAWHIASSLFIDRNKITRVSLGAMASNRH